MSGKAQDDDLVMTLVDLALAKPREQRESFLRQASSGDPDLFREAWSYVEWEDRMQGFLEEPLFQPLSPEHPFEEGALVEGRFRIEREIAQGGMGVVYEAWDEKLERRIAIKCAKTGFRKRLPPEVRHAREISHPNVCKIFEIHTASTRQGDIDFITMEFLEGETLAERLKRGPVPPDEAQTIARQLAAGLAEAHRNQVIHGDLKSNNIILTKTSDGAMRAVITDFGLAHQTPAALATASQGTQGGTPDYMAPELWKGHKASAASDVYALGVILYQLASGHKPHGPEVSASQRLTHRPPVLHSPWDRLLARCLEPDPARRLGDASEVAQVLAPSSSRRWFLLAAAAAVLVVVTGVVTYQRGAAPKESWRLAMLPIESSAEIRDQAASLSRDTAAQLARLKGGDVARLRVISPEVKSPTHVLHAALTNKDGKLVLRAVLTDARTRVNGKEWTAAYAPGELRYAPVALAGMVTAQLGLPPLVVAAKVNSSAMQDYRVGLWNLRRNSTIDTALPLLERAVAEDPDSPLTYAALAEGQQWKWFVSKDAAWLESAKESERQAQERKQDLAQVHRVAGLLSLREGLPELATAECSRAIALDPSDGEAHRVLGQAYEAINRLDEALAEYRKAVEVDPDDYRNHQTLGAFHYGHADYAEALPHYSKMVELAPLEPESHRVLGLDYSTMGRLPEAEYELRLANRLGESPKVLNTLAVVLLEEGKNQEAADNISRALNLGPETLLLRMNLGTAYRLMNRIAESLVAFQGALELGENEIARNPLDGATHSQLAFVCARLGDATRAESEIAQALRWSPDDATVHFQVVASFEAMGRRDDALKLLSTCSYAELADVNRWPDMADLSRDSRFLQLLTARQTR